MYGGLERIEKGDAIIFESKKLSAKRRRYLLMRGCGAGNVSAVDAWLPY
jgi:hypothetical protein